LFREATEHTTLDSSLKNATTLIQNRLNTFLKSKNSDFLKNNTIDITLSVGTAITNATNKKGNKNQHGTILRLERIKDTINRIDENLKLKYYYISDLLNDLEANNKSKDTLDNLIVMRVGLVMFVEIMENFNISELIVSGTGLWYGIYFQQLYKLN
jgi:exopolyphosphatase/pppGpp-phosphohydrolase